jgi:hypothetical protein
MVAPTEQDRDLEGKQADSLLAASPNRAEDLIWCLAPLDQVKTNLAEIDYPFENYRFIEGKVEDTLPRVIPDHLALLRLDTDWYESTRHELEHLYPRLIKNGVLIVDDYGHWRGARQAVDEYFSNPDRKVLLNRIDYTGRIAIKI